MTIKKEKEITGLRQLRWKARTDLVFLCQKILDYPNVEEKLHGPLINVLQSFQKPSYQQSIDHDQWDGKTWQYKPLIDLYKLPGKRRCLILWPRSTLKTTTNVLGHTIQWLLNYPDISMAIFQSNLDKAMDLVQEVKRHFQYNERLRELFPEYCPPADKAKDFGKADRFVSPARKRGRKEPTLVGVSLEKSATGMHFDVMKFTDIVDDNTVKTESGIYSTKKDFYAAEPLLVTPKSWIDVEGTRYHQEDLYGEQIDLWLKQKKEGVETSYNIAISSCWKRKYPEGVEPYYTPDSLSLPFDKDSDGKFIPIWPEDNQGLERLSYNALMEIKVTKPHTYSTQYLNTPEGGIDGREIFEISSSRPAMIKTSDFYTNVRVSYRVLSIDTAETNHEWSNNSAISAGAWGADGRCYVEDIQFGKWLPHELIYQMIEMMKKYKPQTVFIEKTSFTTGLMIGITAAMQRENLYIPIQEVRRSTKVEKIERIQNSLQPWYRSGQLRFVLKEPGESDNTPTRGGINEHNWTQTLKEFRNFPKGSDDILDSLSDLFTGKENFGKLSGDYDYLNGNTDEIRRRKRQSEIEQRNELLLKHIGILDTNEIPYQPSPNDLTGGL